MEYFVWTPELAIGIDEIDNEHMKWIAYINALHSGVEEGKEKEVLEILLNDIITFSGTHFEHEEAMFLETNYPDAAHHIQLHKDYLIELATLKQRLISEQANVLTYDVMLSLKTWLINHVQDVDRQYVSYINERTLIK